MQSVQRLFVGNLPANTQSDDLKDEFSAYGQVKSVDIKVKENVLPNEAANYFAFINIEIDRQMLVQCLDEFGSQAFRGNFLRVSVAKESFLERLKREREEAAEQASEASHKTVYQRPVTVEMPVEALPVIAKTSGTSSEESEESSSESEDEPPVIVKPKFIPLVKQKLVEDDHEVDAAMIDENFIVKKRNVGATLTNGKLKIAPVTNIILNPVPQEKKILDAKAYEADQKRKESMNKMKNTYTQQRMAIKSSLARIDTSAANDEKVVKKTESTSQSKRKRDANTKISLFGNDDDENDEDIGNFEVKEQFEGKKGQRLMQLQSRYQNDKRFSMDGKFLEDDDEDVDDVLGKKAKVNESQPSAEQNEREWQLGILEGVVGKKFQKLEQPQAQNKMLRYDPSIKDHSKFIKKKEQIVKKPEESDGDDVENENLEETEEDKALKSQFYKVNYDLLNSLKTESSGFSLLKLFGADQKDVETVQENDEKCKEKAFLKTAAGVMANPFKYDSSDSEDEQRTVADVTKPKEKPVVGKTDDGGIWRENFFILRGDPRLKEGILFFQANGVEKDEKTDFKVVKQELSQIINIKIRKKVQSLKPYTKKGTLSRKRSTRSFKKTVSK